MNYTAWRIVGVCAVLFGTWILWGAGNFFASTPNAVYGTFGAIQFGLAIVLVVLGLVLVFRPRRN